MLNTRKLRRNQSDVCSNIVLLWGRCRYSCSRTDGSGTCTRVTCRLQRRLCHISSSTDVTSGPGRPRKTSTDPDRPQQTSAAAWDLLSSSLDRRPNAPVESGLRSRIANLQERTSARVQQHIRIRRQTAALIAYILIIQYGLQFHVYSTAPFSIAKFRQRLKDIPALAYGTFPTDNLYPSAEWLTYIVLLLKHCRVFRPKRSSV